jgi:hypothetical protein
MVGGHGRAEQFKKLHPGNKGHVERGQRKIEPPRSCPQWPTFSYKALTHTFHYLSIMPSVINTSRDGVHSSVRTLTIPELCFTNLLGFRLFSILPGCQLRLPAQ